MEKQRIFQTIDFATDCKKVSTFLKRLGKKYPKFFEVWGELIKHGCECQNGFFHEVENDNYVLGVDTQTDGHFYVWFQARCQEQLIDGEGIIYNDPVPVKTTETVETTETNENDDTKIKKYFIVTNGKKIVAFVDDCGDAYVLYGSDFKTELTLENVKKHDFSKLDGCTSANKCFHTMGVGCITDRIFRFDSLIENAETVETIETTETAETVETTVQLEPTENVDYTKMADSDLEDVVISQLDYINNDLMETCVYSVLNGNGNYVHIGDNDFMDVTSALTEYNRRFGVTDIFCLIYRFFESKKTHVEYDSFDDTMHIVEVIPYDENGNIIEYGYYVGDYYIRYNGVTENVKIVETDEQKNTNRNVKINNTHYLVVNNENYNKNCLTDLSCSKYYAMKLLSTNGDKKSWVKTGIYENTIDRVKNNIIMYENNETSNEKNGKEVKKMEKYFIETNGFNMVAFVDNCNMAFALFDTDFETELTLENIINHDFSNLDSCDSAIDCCYSMGFDNTIKRIFSFAELVANAEKWTKIEPTETEYPKNNTDFFTVLRDFYNDIVGGLINDLLDNAQNTNEYYTSFNYLHSGEKLITNICEGFLEDNPNNPDLKNCEIWFIKNTIRDWLIYDSIFAIPCDNEKIVNEICSLPDSKLNQIIDTLNHYRKHFHKSLLIDFVSYKYDVSYNAVNEIYNKYYVDFAIDNENTTLNSVLDDIYTKNIVVGECDI